MQQPRDQEKHSGAHGHVIIEDQGGRSGDRSSDPEIDDDRLMMKDQLAESAGENNDKCIGKAGQCAGDDACSVCALQTKPGK